MLEKNDCLLDTPSTLCLRRCSQWRLGDVSLDGRRDRRCGRRLLERFRDRVGDGEVRVDQLVKKPLRRVDALRRHV